MIGHLKRDKKHLQKKVLQAEAKVQILTAALASAEQEVAHYRHRLHVEQVSRS